MNVCGLSDGVSSVHGWSDICMSSAPRGMPHGTLEWSAQIASNMRPSRDPPVGSHRCWQHCDCCPTLPVESHPAFRSTYFSLVSFTDPVCSQWEKSTSWPGHWASELYQSPSCSLPLLQRVSMTHLHPWTLLPWPEEFPSSLTRAPPRGVPICPAAQRS